MNTNKPIIENINLTGAELTPKRLKKMFEASAQFPPDIPGDGLQSTMARSEVAIEADAIGSIPLPVTAKGTLKKAFSKLLGEQPEIFLDKLGERLAFERTGVRLYDLAIAKAIGLSVPKNVLNQLKHIREEEVEHMNIITMALKTLGADPTAMTPCADLTGVMGLGFMQVLSDPRTNMSQAMDALLNAEVLDNAAWELLIELASVNGQQTLAEEFNTALIQEQEHLAIIRSLVKEYMAIK